MVTPLNWSHAGKITHSVARDGKSWWARCKLNLHNMVSRSDNKADIGFKTDALADELLLRMQKIQGIRRPTKRSQSNLSNLISNTQSLVSDESDWIRCGPDLAALGRGAEHGWLNTFLEDMLNKISRKVTVASVTRSINANCHAYPSTLSPMQSSMLNVPPISCLTNNTMKPGTNDHA